MDIHLLKSDGVEEFAKNPHAFTLLLTGLAEIHSNAEMFGGLESVGFKIKWKSINQRGKQILKLVDEERIFQLAEKLSDEAFGDRGVYLYSERQELTSKFNDILQTELNKNKK